MNPYVIDLHFEVLRGVGWNQFEIPETLVSSPVTADVSSKTFDIVVESTSGFLINQLICFDAIDGQYYAAVIKSIQGSTISLKTSLEVGLAAGAIVRNFYANDAHPNKQGFKALVDGSVRALKYEEELVTSFGFGAWSSYGPATIHPDTTFAYNNPGSPSAVSPGLLVSASAVDGGAITSPLALLAGVYEICVPVSVGQRVGGFSGSVLIDVVETTKTGEQLGVCSFTATGFDGVKFIKGLFAVQPGSSVRVLVRNANGGGAYFSVGNVRIYRTLGKIPSLDHGTHVLFGDSWVTHPIVKARLQERFPNATFIAKGVAGNRSIELVARFFADVPQFEPDFVWVMCGTNDIYSGLTPSRFSAEMNTIKRNIAMIGARAIFWNCSVGSAFYPGFQGEQLTNSRKYAMNVNYHNQMA